MTLVGGIERETEKPFDQQAATIVATFYQRRTRHFCITFYKNVSNFTVDMQIFERQVRFRGYLCVIFSCLPILAEAELHLSTCDEYKYVENSGS